MVNLEIDIFTLQGYNNISVGTYCVLAFLNQTQWLNKHSGCIAEAQIQLRFFLYPDLSSVVIKHMTSTFHCR